MATEYCHKCNRLVDLDEDVEHFDEEPCGRKCAIRPREPNRIEYSDADGADINRLADEFGRD